MKTTRNFFQAALLGGLLLATASAWAADGTPLWTNRFNGSGNNYDLANSLALAGLAGLSLLGLRRKIQA